MVLTGISPVNNYVQHIFMCLFAICTFLMKFLFKCFALYFFSIGFFFFFFKYSLPSGFLKNVSWLQVLNS